MDDFHDYIDISVKKENWGYAIGSEGPVYKRQDWECAALAYDIYETDLKAFQAFGVIDRAKLKALCVSGIIYKAHLEAREITFRDIAHVILPTGER
jgi:biotin synthase-like enzyme